MHCGVFCLLAFVSTLNHPPAGQALEHQELALPQGVLGARRQGHGS